MSTQSWLISFGDLLTLVLCFFIAEVSFQKPSNSSNQLNNYSQNSTNFQAGTGVALTSDDNKDNEVEILSDGIYVKKSVQKLTLNSLPRSSKEWGRVLTSLPQEVSVTACSTAGFEIEEDGVFIARLGVSVEALKDFGVKKINIQEGCVDKKSFIVYG